jgi:hypothetical protein
MMSFKQWLYQLLQDGKREMLHLFIGRRLLNSLVVDGLQQQHVFVVASLFMFYISLGLVEEDEKEAVATMLLQAGNGWLHLWRLLLLPPSLPREFISYKRTPGCHNTESVYICTMPHPRWNAA